MNEIGFLLADNSRLARWAFDQRVREAGVTGPQARLLMNVARVPGQNQGFYAEKIEVEPITLCRMVDRLEEAGLLERRRDLADRRAWQLHLTDKSRPMVAQLRDKVDALVRDMLGGLTPEEQGEFKRLLTRVGGNLAALRDDMRAGNG